MLTSRKLVCQPPGWLPEWEKKGPRDDFGRTELTEHLSPPDREQPLLANCGILHQGGCGDT